MNAIDNFFEWLKWKMCIGARSFTKIINISLTHPLVFRFFLYLC